ncbi:hypothetical protein AB2713_19190 [Citrobacter werkmanii]|uniref:hypothetical protein n=1 Tax=Citrobacter werkmanii TaxID=67827 RepID=UPI0034645554
MMILNEDIQAIVDTQMDYKKMTLQTETFILECLEHAENESEAAPDEWLESAWVALDVWYMQAGDLYADKVTREVDRQRLETMIVRVETGIP